LDIDYKVKSKQTEMATLTILDFYDYSRLRQNIDACTTRRTVDHLTLPYLTL